LEGIYPKPSALTPKQKPRGQAGNPQARNQPKPEGRKLKQNDTKWKNDEKKWRAHAARQLDSVGCVGLTACRVSSFRRLKTVTPLLHGLSLRVSQACQTDDVYFVVQRESLHKRIETMSAQSMVSRFPGMFFV
jgi:hypothetical protein